MEEQGDSLGAFLRLVQTWAEGARDEEIRRLIETLAAELRRRGYQVRCEVTRKRGPQ